MFSPICHGDAKELEKSILISGHTFVFTQAFNTRLNAVWLKEELIC